QRGANFLDSGAHFYDTYETADGNWVSVGSIEPQFYDLLLKHTGVDDPEFQTQFDNKKCPEFKRKLAELFTTKPRADWCEIMEGTDVCFGPVLTLNEAPEHPHNVARKTFVEVDGVLQPGPAPRFSRTRPEIQGPPVLSGENRGALLSDWGFKREEIEALKAADAI
ncbi:MAG: CoA transferase, partial [Desulfobacterales bacterium]|nr:CoA transferase [Desulfobacterales bacterium]